MRLAIVGASARAAAFSALAAGHHVVAADLFADVDLAARCQVHRLTDWPNEVGNWLARVIADAWIYTGGLENHADIVELAATRLPLLGTPAAALRRLRDPLCLQRAAHARGVFYPETTATSQVAYGELSGGAAHWMVRRHNSAGGSGISRAHRSAPRDDRHYWQRLIAPGESFAALFAVNDQRATLLGVTRQLVGQAGHGAAEFGYGGSLSCSQAELATMRAALDTIGVLLVDLGAMGVVGVDLVHQASRTWLIEVNPRYPASAEVIETERQQSIIDWHVATCRGEPRPATRAASAQNVAKLIVFADQPHTASPAFVDWCMSHCLAAGGPLADVPRRHTRFSPGDPLVSVIATDQYAPLAVARDWCRRVRCQLAAVDSLD